MRTPLLFFVIPLSPLIASWLDSKIKRRLPILLLIGLLTISLLLLTPIFFTEYSYGDVYSNCIVIAFVLIVINFCWMRYAGKNIKKWIAISISLILLIPISLIFFGKAFVGEPTIYDKAFINEYKVVYLRESSPGLNEPDKVELYQTIMFGLLIKLIDIEYVDNAKSECVITLIDTSNNREILYNPCKMKIISE